MKIFYEGVDITSRVRVAEAVFHDYSGGKCDSLELVMGDAGSWHRWNPQLDDKIMLTRDGYSTGTLYLNAVMPEEGNYRIIATAAPSTARKKESKSFENRTVGEIMAQCAAECGMKWKLWGIPPHTKYAYISRRAESAAAFLSKIAEMEGATLKVFDGTFLMISITEAQELPALETMRLKANQTGTVYTKNELRKTGRLTVIAPFGSVSAEDPGAAGSHEETETMLPAGDAVTAGRWARGLLLCANRRAEQLTVQDKFHPGWTAMVRVDVTGDTAANGAWLVDNVCHDFVNGTSRAEFVRKVTTVR